MPVHLFQECAGRQEVAGIAVVAAVVAGKQGPQDLLPLTCLDVVVVKLEVAVGGFDIVRRDDPKPVSE